MSMLILPSGEKQVCKEVLVIPLANVRDFGTSIPGVVTGRSPPELTIILR